jgi:hypothetical protein
MMVVTRVALESIREIELFIADDQKGVKVRKFGTLHLRSRCDRKDGPGYQFRNLGM